MCQTPAEPDWSRLPHDPVGFFGLGAGFDRRDLKRAYNALLRHYKPEKFPQEFQRIRAAYEQLESNLRYGHSSESFDATPELPKWMTEGSAELPDETGPPAGAAMPEPQPKISLRPQRLRLLDRLQTENATAIYRELTENKEKSPYDFYALAVMSDIVDPGDGQQFVRWILKGLAAFPNEIGLMHVLHSYVRGHVEPEACDELLVTCSKVLPEGAFFPLTEPLWRLLLRTQPFDRFRTLLAQCEANLKGVNIDNRLAFYLQILKPAMWVAGDDWTNAAYAFLEQNYDRIPRFLDYDVEIISRLKKYMEHRPRFTNGTELQQRLDRALRDYFSEDQLTGDRSVLECQVQITEDTAALAAAFGNLGDPAYAPFFALWNWVTYDVGERHVEPLKEQPDGDLWYPRTRLLLQQLALNTANSKLGLKWYGMQAVYGLSIAGCFLLTLLIVAIVPTALVLSIPGLIEIVLVDVLVVVLFSGLAIFAAVRLSRRYREKAWTPYWPKLAQECYRQQWQPEILGFLARSHLSYQMLLAFVRQDAGINSKAGWIAHFVGQDFALPMFALAQRFMI